MEKLKKFVRETIGETEKDQALYQRIEFHDSENGFYAQWIHNNGEYKYRLYVPQNKRDTDHLLVRLTVRHEIGHIIFNEMFYNEEELHHLERILSHIYHDHSFFAFIQKFWYWNRVLRKLKRWAGFSANIQYKPDDLYDSDISIHVTRACNELFCDYFAVYVKKKYNFFLDR